MSENNENCYYYQKNISEKIDEEGTNEYSSINKPPTTSNTTITTTTTTTTHLTVPQRKTLHSNHQAMRFVIISDTHNLHEMLDLPVGDVLLHCGDFTNLGLYGEVDTFFQYLIDHCDGVFKYVILIVGNHEWAPDIIVYPRFQKFFRENSSKTLKSQYHLLLDESVTIVDGNNCPIKIHGVRYRGCWTPPPYFKKTTFNIPPDIDILMTHFPCNKFKMDESSTGVSRGSAELTRLLDSNYFTNLKIHCFGHNHNPNARGFAYEKDRVYINAISVIGNKEDKLIGKPFVFDF